MIDACFLGDQRARNSNNIGIIILCGYSVRSVADHCPAAFTYREPEAILEMKIWGAASL